MEALEWARRPALKRPVLVAAFAGWNDAGDAATTAARHLATRWQASRFATIHSEDFFDFTTQRPTVRVDDAGIRHIDWPDTKCSAGSIAGTRRDVIVIEGVEPHLRWRTFCTQVGRIARELDVELVVTLGALLADVPHSRAVRLTGTAPDPEVVARLGLTTSRYEGPTGIVGVLHDEFRASGIASCSLWAAVPHYLPGTPSPKAALALVEHCAKLLSAVVPVTDLQIASAQYERQASEAVSSDEDLARYVHQLEAAFDSGELDDDDEDDDDDDFNDDDDESVIAHPETAAQPGALTDEFGNVPTGDDLAQELERFLRNGDSGSEDGGPAAGGAQQ